MVDKKEKGKKQSKQRITVCVATNADGTDRLPLHFIGKSKVPIPLRNRDVLAEIGATYTNTAKAWMNTLSNVVIHKLPPNTTAALQPMDQGIIKSLKDEYHEKKEDAELDMFYSGVAYKPVDIFSAMKWLSEGWGDISTKTIRNCWCHTGIVSKMDMGYLLN
ncbi:hypothetical protein PF004_g27851 [Phytophthora fragariae]|uniref:DDE-1 domain-containing protein n=1 Tax=Phytophthora fragariae TaxID=53985 RepID=A0A6A3GXV8_9STRA|nr:hypothetical protein PF011_g29656 [Phytophthora fragariae]KAE9170512.1 hypothetical protein PF004_g27851 [Phytophthora fragariae]